MSKYALLLTALRCLWQELVLVVPSRACLIAFTFTQPFLISRSIRFLTEPESSNTANYGYGLIGATALIYLGIAVCILSLTYEALLITSSFVLFITASAGIK